VSKQGAGIAIEGVLKSNKSGLLNSCGFRKKHQCRFWELGVGFPQSVDYPVLFTVQVYQYGLALIY